MSLRSELSHKLSLTQSHKLNEELADYACVAVILKGQNWQSLEVAYIRRSVREQDRWSGQVAFPGGKAEPDDKSDLMTAIRETFEEIGVTLTPEEMVGYLDDIQARKQGQLLEFFIRPFIFYVERNLETILGPNEVDEILWIPLSELVKPQRQIQYEFIRESLNIQLPAIQLEKDPPLWGLTYMMTQNLLRILKFSSAK